MSPGRMPVGAASNAAREGRVHHDQRGTDGWIEKIVNQFSVMSTDDSLRKNSFEQIRSVEIDLVEIQTTARIGGRASQQSSSGRRLQDMIRSERISGSAGKPGEGKRSRESLEVDLLLVAMGLRRK